MPDLACFASAVEGDGWDASEAVCLGVGMARAAATLSATLTRSRPDRVVLFGVGGAFPARHRDQGAPPVGVGDVCVVGRDAFGDCGVELPDGFRSLEALGLSDAAVFELDEAGHATRVAASLGVPVVRGVTVARGSGTESASAELARRSAADVETMEGAAVAMVCADHRVPLVHIRAISNWTGDRDRGGWNLDTACHRAREAARQWIEGPRE